MGIMVLQSGVAHKAKLLETWSLSHEEVGTSSNYLHGPASKAVLAPGAVTPCRCHSQQGEFSSRKCH